MYPHQYKWLVSNHATYSHFKFMTTNFKWPLELPCIPTFLQSIRFFVLLEGSCKSSVLSLSSASTSSPSALPASTLSYFFTENWATLEENNHKLPPQLPSSLHRDPFTLPSLPLWAMIWGHGLYGIPFLLGTEKQVTPLLRQFSLTPEHSRQNYKYAEISLTLFKNLWLYFPPRAIIPIFLLINSAIQKDLSTMQSAIPLFTSSLECSSFRPVPLPLQQNYASRSPVTSLLWNPRASSQASS